MALNARAAVVAITLGAVAATAAPERWITDIGYGPGGVRSFAGVAGEATSLVASASDTRGRTVAVGTLDRGGERDLMILRFDFAGTPDPSFGFDGLLIIDAGSHDEAALAVVLQRDDRIVIGAEIGGRVALLRLLPDGAIDGSFGTDGRIVPNFLNGSGWRLAALVLDPSGRIVAVGSVVNGGEFPVVNPFVMRIETDGTLDRAFDGDGVRVLREIEGLGAAVGFAASSRIVLVANQASGQVLAALDGSGALDATFGDGGTTRTELGPGAIATDLVEHGGGLYVSGLGPALLLKYSVEGVRDDAFAVQGAGLGAWAVQPLADGTLVVVGSCRGPGGEGWMLGLLDASGAWTVEHCAMPSPGFAALRGVTGDTHRLFAVGTEMTAAGIRGAAVGFVRAVAAPTRTGQARNDKRCKKRKFRLKHPGICAR